MRSFPAFVLTAALCLAASTLAAQELWETKRYQEWSKADTEKMLHNSPWAQHVTLSRVVMTGMSTGNRGVTGMGNQAAVQDAQHSELPYLTYTAQVRSAMPIRQAVVRQRQLAENYEKKKEKEREALDAKTNAYLARPQDDIVIFVAIDSNVINYANQAKRYWQKQSYELLKNSVFLTIAGERLTPFGFAANDEGFQFNFERPPEVPKNSTIMLEFTHPTISSLNSEVVRIEFKVSKMLVDGVPAL